MSASSFTFSLFVRMNLWRNSNEFGKIIPDLLIHGRPAPYPVLNERAIRATAGIMFLAGISVFFTVLLTGDRTLVRIVVPLFFADFLLKTLQGARFSPFSILGSWLVRNQRPEYVGAIQKRFAWGIGLFMSSLMMLFVFVFKTGMTIPMIICTTCLLFMWMETSLGICVGCKIYKYLTTKGWLQEPEYYPACPGGVCTLPQQAQ